jgi:hypothetical protein
LEHLGVDGRIILKWFLEKYYVRVWAAFSWSRIGSSCGFCEYGSEPSVFEKDGECLD